MKGSVRCSSGWGSAIAPRPTVTPNPTPLDSAPEASDPRSRGEGQAERQRSGRRGRQGRKGFWTDYPLDSPTVRSALTNRHLLGGENMPLFRSYSCRAVRISLKLMALACSVPTLLFVPAFAQPINCPPGTTYYQLSGATVGGENILQGCGKQLPGGSLRPHGPWRVVSRDGRIIDQGNAVDGIRVPRKDRQRESANPVVPNATFGPFRHGTFPSLESGDQKWTHAGVDLVAPAGSPVYAFGDGTVRKVITQADPEYYWGGNAVMLEHPTTLKKTYTIYLHLQEAPLVRPGDRVEAGKTQIGKVGHTGHANNADHVHFEIRYFEAWLSEWNNIYGQEDQRKSDYFRAHWEDPLEWFARYPTGLDLKPKELTQEKRMAITNAPGERQCVEKFTQAYVIAVKWPAYRTPLWEFKLRDKRFDQLHMEMQRTTLGETLWKYYGSWQECVDDAETVVGPYRKAGGRVEGLPGGNWWPQRPPEESRLSEFQEFSRRYSVQQVTACKDLETNPFAFGDKTIAFSGYLDVMVAADTGLVRGGKQGDCPIILSGIPANTFSAKKAVILVAGKIVGRKEITVGEGRRVNAPEVSFRGVYFCKQQQCIDIVP